MFQFLKNWFLKESREESRDKKIDKARQTHIKAFIDGDFETVNSLFKQYGNLICSNEDKEEKLCIMRSFNIWAYWEYSHKKIVNDKDTTRLILLIESDLFNSSSMGKFIADYIIAELYYKIGSNKSLSQTEQLLTMYKSIIQICVQSENVCLFSIFQNAFKNCCSINYSWQWNFNNVPLQMKCYIESLQILIESGRIQYNKIMFNADVVKSIIQSSKDFIECLHKIEEQLIEV